jgi:hypothetical protein
MIGFAITLLYLTEKETDGDRGTALRIIVLAVLAGIT